jgi:hypothetical protein
MILRRLFTALASFALLAGGLALVPTTASAHTEADFQLLAAPFECDTEWVGGTRSGHGQNDWNLDINRTSLVWPDRQHDMGQPLLAQGDGVVAYVGLHISAGTYLDIDYGDYTVRYVHLIHDSIPAGVDQRGDVVQQGDLIGLIGDTGNATGHAHLHLEYWDSREMEVAEGWRLRNAGYPQTEITFDGNVIDPQEVFVSTNCVDRPPGTVFDAHVQALTDPATALDHLTATLARTTEALDGTTDAAAYLDVTANGTNVFARIPGTDLGAETVLVSTSYSSVANCGTEEAPLPCPGATAHAASTALVLEMAAQLAGAEVAPRRTIVVAFWDDYDADGGAALEWLTAYEEAARTDVVAAIDYGVAGANATLGLRPDTTVSLTALSSWSTLGDRFASRASVLHQFGGSALTRPTAAILSTGPFPTVAFSDIVGSCVATLGDTHAVVDEAKLGSQLDEAVAMVSDLGSTDTLPTIAIVDPDSSLLADAVTLLKLAAAAGHDVSAYAELQAFIDEPAEVIDASHHDLFVAAVEHFGATVVAEPCDAHLAPAPFVDMRLGSYATADVSLLFDLGITTGTSPTSYSPTDVVTREQMAAFIARVWRLVHPDAAATGDHPFLDVNPDSFAAADINLIWELGITTGTAPDTYDPDGLVTRRQMAAFLCRLWLLLHPDAEPGGEHPFTDIAVEDYAGPHVALIYTLGITTGTSTTTYSPDDVVTREQMAAFLGRVIRALTPAPPS